MTFMADLRCPMCGKSNPPQIEVCQYCQARLKPLIVPSADESEPGASGESEDLFHAGDGALPDWLDDLRDDDEPRAEDQEEEAGEDGAEIWSSEEEQRLSSAFTFSAEEESVSDEDWLARLTGDEESQPEDQALDQDEPGESPTSAAFLNMDEVTRDEASSDWLAEFQTSSLGLEEPVETLPQSDDQGEEASPEGERPHWLDLIRSQQQKESELSASIPPQEEEDPEDSQIWGGKPAGEEGQSDWLSDIGMEEGEEELSIDSKDLPGWLAESGAFQAESQAESEPAFPGWMVESDLPEDETAPEAGEGLPDWIAASPAAGTGESKKPRQDLPDWLSNVSEQDVDQSGLPEPVESGEGDDFPAEEEGGLPDWLTKLEATAGEQASGSGVPALILDEEEETPGEAGAEEPEILPDQDISTVPDWLTQVAAQDEQVEGVAPAEGDLEPDLAAAQLPSWLQAMRPVESAAPSAPAAKEREKLVEKVGPLAGLAGVLPAEPEFVHLSKPKSSLVKLQVSDNQQTHITLLENLLAEEGQAKPVAARSAITSQYFLRLVIALVVFISVIAPLWLNRQLLPLPEPAGVSNEVFDFSRALAGLPSGAPVLVAFDYEPSFSGELDALAAATIGEAAGRGAQLVMISTNPTGPILAERFMTTRLANTGAGYLNLGYIPGGAAGLLAFAQTPRDLSPFDLRGARVWETTLLAPVNSLSDFAMVMVLTENPDTARSWIEQVQPVLGAAGKPLLMVLSAQAEPMVRPYYETNPKQVNGMISGLAGGAAFESISGREGIVRLYWDAFGTGLVIAAALMLLGGIASLALALISKPDVNEGKGVL
jgi:hypothetical protein